MDSEVVHKTLEKWPNTFIDILWHTSDSKLGLELAPQNAFATFCQQVLELDAFSWLFWTRVKINDLMRMIVDIWYDMKWMINMYMCDELTSNEQYDIMNVKACQIPRKF